MTRKVLLAGLAGGVALFVWGIVAWTVLPVYGGALRTLPGEDRVVQALREGGATRGVYVVPALPRNLRKAGTPASEADQAWAEKFRRGPRALLVYDPSGRSPTRMFRPLARALALCLAAATFSAFVLSRLRIHGHFARIFFLTALGLFGWLLGPALLGVWFFYPADYLLAALAEALGGWLIVGVVQAGMVKP